MKRIILITVGLLSNLIFSQGYYPFGVKWRYIETPAAQIVYPQGLKPQAERIGNIVNYIAEKNPNSIGDKTGNGFIILQSDQVVPNGFVGLFPYRSSFNSSSAQNMYDVSAADWIDGLSIKEYRSMLQFSNTLKGLSSVAYWFLGETAISILGGFSVPNWFFEGDAILSQTLLSNSGRGRLPSFSKEQRALLLSDRPLYNYDKARNGSLKDIVPSPSALGYVACNYVRNHYGSPVWKNVFSEATSYKGFFYSFSKSLKHHTGHTTRQLYQLSYQDLKDRYQKYLEQIPIQEAKRVTDEPEAPTDYLFPHYLKEGIIALKSGYKETGKIVHLSGDDEKTLVRVGLQTEPFISVNQRKIVWTELRKNLRRDNQNYNALVVYDLLTDEKHYIKTRTKFFSPHYAHSKDQIIAVEVTPQMKNHLVILDPKNGQVSKRLKNQNNDFIIYPKWTKDDKSIVYIAKRASKLTILKQHIKTGQIQQLIPWTTHSIGQFTLTDSTVYFSASFSGIDNIYSVGLEGGNLEQVTSVKIGTYMPHLSSDKKTLLFSEFTNRGHQISELPVSEMAEKIQIADPVDMPIFNVTTDSVAQNILDKVPQKTYPEKSYTSFIKDVSMYNWLVYSDFNGYFEASADFGDTFENWDIGLLYSSTAEEYKRYQGVVTYSRLYPVLSLGISRIERDTINPEPTISLADSILSGYSENILSFGARVPLTRYYGNNFQTLSLSSKLNYRNIDGKSLDLFSLEHQLTATHTTRKAIQHIFPRWGVEIDVIHSKSITSSVSVEKIDLEGSVYMPPRLLPNDGIKLSGQYMDMTSEASGYSFPNSYSVSRGFGDVITAVNLNGFKKWTVDYAFPLAYPDVGGAGLFYINRLRTNLFYDHVETSYTTKTNQVYESTGLTLTADGVLFNFITFSASLTGGYFIENPTSDDSYGITFGLTTLLNQL